MSDEAQSNLQVAEKIAALLVAENTPAVVIGAVALAAHRYIRFTEDIDLGINADPAQMRALAETLRLEGFDAELHEADASDPLGGVIDISGSFGLVQIISFENKFPAAIRDALGGEEVKIHASSSLRIVPIPQLVALKLYAGGIKAQADILELLRRNPEIDLSGLRKICKEYRLEGLDEILEELNEIS